MNYGIVVLSRYPQYARDLLSSIRKTHSTLPSVVVVRDRHKESFDYISCSIMDGASPFVFARNSNCGIDLCGSDDVILCNDDMTCVQEDFFHRLASIANKFPRCGIMSPLIDGGVGNELQQFPPNGFWPQGHDEIAIQGTTYDSLPICFPCVYIKRRLINEIGMLDENFTEYGGEDCDYCIRARKAGWLTMITRQLYIKHGAGGNSLDRGVNWSLSFAKEPSVKNNQQYLIHKHSS